VREHVSPYLGLAPFDAEDAWLFFGREREVEVAVANFEASRFTLLYGASGVGKSSLLRAGVFPAVETEARSAGSLGPRFFPVVFSTWNGNPVEDLLATLERALRASGRDDVPAWSTSGEPLDRALLECTERFGELFLILDQFEEYLAYHPDADDSFSVDFPAVVRDPQIHVNVLLSIREDALGALDRFNGRIPRLFERYLRVEDLDRAAARAAIEGPLDRFGRLGRAQVTIERAVVEAVLDALVAEQDRIQASYLQIVMYRLWGEEQARGSSSLRLATLEELGGTRRIVDRHAADALDALSRREKETAARIFQFLVTPSRAKLALSIPDLAAFTDLSVSVVRPVVTRLADVRILRQLAASTEQDKDVTRYVIYHDALATPILDWRLRFEAEAGRGRLLRQAARRFLHT
jgi:hypothetical protein